MTHATRPSEFLGKRVAFVSTRIAGKDGVSLEIEKWARVLERMGVECFYIAGECDRPRQQSVIIEQAHFSHPDIVSITNRAFEAGPRNTSLTDDITALTQIIRNQLNAAIKDMRIDTIIAQNALTIPMNIPLGNAIVQSTQELRIGCIAHHHDFYWERERYLTNSVADFIHYAFPPALPEIQHVVINSVAAEEFSRRTGLYCRIIPNIMDFSHPPSPADEYARSFRAQIGVGEDDLLILQPTRVVARKGIEHSVELVRRLARKGAKLVITHSAGDEGNTYGHFLGLLSELMKVEVVFADHWVADQRGTAADGQRLYTLDDVYSQADLVSYPSEYEGFGNALLEAVYYRQPILCKRYLIYRADIEPCGFRTIAFDHYLSRETMAEVERVLSDTVYRQKMVEHNLAVAQQYFSYEVLEEELRPILRRACLSCGPG